MRARVQDPLNYSFGDQQILETNSFKYSGIIICRHLSWAVQANYTVYKKSGRHFIYNAYIQKGK
jgi:hypothetical protein